eukprot:jgi/Hompol1/4266/HPOL_007081-RA
MSKQFGQNAVTGHGLFIGQDDVSNKGNPITRPRSNNCAELAAFLRAPQIGICVDMLQIFTDSMYVKTGLEAHVAVWRVLN